MVFELDMDQGGYNLQCGYEGSSKYAIVNFLTGNHKEFQAGGLDVIPFSHGYN